MLTDTDKLYNSLGTYFKNHYITGIPTKSLNGVLNTGQEITIALRL